MERVRNPNLVILQRVVDRLDDLADEMVFVGGCATGLLITDAAAPPLRVTRDVDAIVQVYSRAEYYRLSEKLRGKGFHEDTSKGAPLCRWVADELILDVMPTDSKILGFSNRWYAAATSHATEFLLSGNKQIRLVSPPYFLITKLEAFAGRGRGDYLFSHDIEDVVAVLDGRPELVDEIKASSPELREELSRRLVLLMKDQNFIDAVYGHMPSDEASQRRATRIIKLVSTIAGSAGNS